MAGRMRGFTLVEFMVTVAVLGIVLGLGVPGFAALSERMRTLNALHLLTASLAQARMEAIRRNAPVAACPSADGLRCTEGVAWEGGWILFTDPARLGRPRSRGDVLQVFEPIGPGLRLRATSGRRLVRFTPNGWSAGSNVSIRLCGKPGAPGGLLAAVIVNNAGRIRSERPETAAPCPFG